MHKVTREKLPVEADSHNLNWSLPPWFSSCIQNLKLMIPVMPQWTPPILWKKLRTCSLMCQLSLFRTSLQIHILVDTALLLNGFRECYLEAQKHYWNVRSTTLSETLCTYVMPMVPPLLNCAVATYNNLWPDQSTNKKCIWPSQYEPAGCEI